MLKHNIHEKYICSTEESYDIDEHPLAIRLWNRLKDNDIEWGDLDCLPNYKKNRNILINACLIRDYHYRSEELATDIIDEYARKLFALPSTVRPGTCRGCNRSDSVSSDVVHPLHLCAQCLAKIEEAREKNCLTSFYKLLTIDHIETIGW